MFVPWPYESKCPLIWQTLPHRRRVALQFSLMMCNGNGGKEGKESAHAPVA